MVNNINSSGGLGTNLGGLSNDVLDDDSILQSRERQKVKQKSDPLSSNSNSDVAVAATAMGNIHVAHSEGIVKNVGQVVMENSAKRNESFERINADAAFLKSVGAVDGKTSIGATADEAIPRPEIDSRPNID